MPPSSQTDPPAITMGRSAPASIAFALSMSRAVGAGRFGSTLGGMETSAVS